MKLSGYISTIILLVLFGSFLGCDLFHNDSRLVPFDEDIDVWLAEEINPEYSNSPQLYLSLKPGRMYTAGYDIYATYSMIDSKIEVEVYGMITPGEGAYPDVMLWPEISFPVGNLFGQYDLILNYDNMTDVYRIEVSGETITMVPIETNFSRNPFSSFRRYEPNTIACRLFYPGGIQSEQQTFFNGVVDSLNQFDGITGISYNEDKIALTFNQHSSYSMYYFPDSTSMLSSYFRYDTRDAVLDIQNFIERKKEDVYSLYNFVDIINWSDLGD